jgi:phosphate transport system substrate-binding protein
MRPWSVHSLVACVCLVLSLPGLGREAVRVGGTGAALGGLQALGKAYTHLHPDCDIVVLPSVGSTGGIRAVLEGKLDLACTSRALYPAEQVTPMAHTPWATTPFVFATQDLAPAEPLTLAGIEDIYAGRRLRWKDDRPIRLVLRPTSDTAHAYLAGVTPGMEAALHHAHQLPGVYVGITDQEALTYLERTPGSFGTTVLGLIVSEKRRVQVLPVNGVLPSQPGYPFHLTLALVHRGGHASPATQDFLAFATSAAGGRILASCGYRLIPAPAPPTGVRPPGTRR